MKKEEINVIIDSNRPWLSAGVVNVLSLQTTQDHLEWNEGAADAKADFEAGKPMPNNLNYPVHPYARGYVETYRYLKNP